MNAYKIKIAGALAASLVAGFVGCADDELASAIKATGEIDARTTTVSAEIGGKVIDAVLEEGAEVNAGDVLVRIGGETRRLQLEQAEGALDAAEARYQLLRKGARSEDVFQAEKARDRAEAAYAQAEKDYERMKRLLESESVTERQFDQAETAYKTAKAAYEAAEKNVRKIANLARPEELRQAEAATRQARAARDLAKVALDKLVVTAPAAGTVVERYIEPGEIVAPGGAIAKIARLDRLEMTVYLSPPELGKIKIGDSAIVYADVYPDKPYPARIKRISSEAEFTPKSIQTKDERTKRVFAVTLDVENADLELKDGMFADAILETGESDGSVD
jgi:HlyD family secretion protein